MRRIQTTKSDVIWNYVGTIASMTSGFLLLPFLLFFLGDDELGLWYVFVAIGDLALLFEFGFNPTFARNIVYTLSGARKLSRRGFDESQLGNQVDYQLLRVLCSTTRMVFAVLSIGVLLLAGSLGTVYIGFITNDIAGINHWIGWLIFVISMFLNLYFYYYLTFLRGVGDVAGENKAKTFSKLLQLGVTAALLFCGMGLVGASIGYLANGVALRFFARHQLRKHEVESQHMLGSLNKVSLEEKKSTFMTVFDIAWRDGLVQLAVYASTRATTIISSIMLGLAFTGTYSVMLQLATAVYQLASAYVRSFYPAFQAAYAVGDKQGMRRVVGKGLVAYYALFCLGVLGVLLIVFPLLPVFRPGISVDIAVFLLLCAYEFLLQQHSLCCRFIISMNVIPYMRGYVVAAFAGIACSVALMASTDLGVWGLILGQFIVQLAYNNWKWPIYLLDAIEDSYLGMLRRGAIYWLSVMYVRFRGEK